MSKNHTAPLGCLLLLTVAVVTGCSASPSPSATVTVAQSSPTSVASAPATSPAPKPELLPIVPAGFSPVDPAAYAPPSGMGFEFDSPSRNIHCGTYDRGADNSAWGCSISEYDYTDPPNDGSCNADEEHYGGGYISRDWNTVAVLCRGGAEFGGEMTGLAVNVLPYGSSISYLEITCTSASDGVACYNTRTRAWFELSRSESEYHN
jgi:hypothetical protein